MNQQASSGWYTTQARSICRAVRPLPVRIAGSCKSSSLIVALLLPGLIFAATPAHAQSDSVVTAQLHATYDQSLLRMLSALIQGTFHGLGAPLEEGSVRADSSSRELATTPSLAPNAFGGEGYFWIAVKVREEDCPAQTCVDWSAYHSQNLGRPETRLASNTEGDIGRLWNLLQMLKVQTEKLGPPPSGG